LGIPEVIEIVSILKILADPQSSDALVRVLSNPRWRIGPEDLWVLNAYSRALERQDATDPLDGETSPLEAIDHPSMINGILRLPKDNWTSSQGQTFSAVGLQRMQRFAKALHTMMAQIHLPIPTLIRQIEKTTGLGIEVGVRPGHASVDARRYLDEFLKVAETFQASADHTRTLDLDRKSTRLNSSHVSISYAVFC